ncbi:MAG TPA: FdrA family protein, partial [Elusimicrobiota bacterium]|nr:FdrA family protein [Elusimicrobiota bacterium]
RNESEGDVKLGTGGRDVKKDVGGISFLQGLNALVEDKTTKVVLLVSKPPYPDVLKKILAEIKKVKKPVVSIFLGGDTAGLRKAGVHAFDTLEEAALAAVSLSGGGKTDKIAAQLAARDKKLESLAKAEAKRLAKGQKFCRGLFSGGTFCSEALLILSEMLGDVHSNIPLKPGLKLQNSMKSVANTVIDMGEDEFTVGRPHPMIDYSLRNKKILEEANASETAVILLDVVLGYGSTPQPLEDILPALQEAFAVVRKNRRGLSVVCSVTGTDKDPQNRSKVVQGLEKAGCLVQPSNAAACRLAGRIVKSANV